MKLLKYFGFLLECRARLERNFEFAAPPEIIEGAICMPNELGHFLLREKSSACLLDELHPEQRA